MPVSAAPAPQAGARILVVDDAEEWRHIVKRTLAEQGFVVETASDGAEALARVRQDPPEVLLLDVHMPGISGYEVLRTLRAEARFEDLPVVLLTAQDRIEGLVEGFELGADDYLTKPFRRPELLARIAAILRVRQLQRQVRRAAKTAAYELKIARSVQRRILPLPLPRRDGLELAAAYHPCYALGGDFFDVVPMAGGGTGIFMADVMGHGIAAALITSFLKAQLFHETQDADGEIDPQALFLALNRGLASTFPDSSLYATAVLMVFDPAQGAVRYLKAGHPHPLVLRVDGSAHYLEGGGLPLGLHVCPDYQVYQERLGVGDRVFLYTDGIPEQPHPRTRERYGLPRLEARLQECTGAPLEETVRRVEADLLDWAGGEPEDDMNLVGFERR